MQTLIPAFDATPATAFDLAGQPKCHLASPGARAGSGRVPSFSLACLSTATAPLRPTDAPQPSPSPGAAGGAQRQGSQGLDGALNSGSRVLQELAKLHSETPATMNDDCEGPSLGVGASRSISQRRRSIDQSVSILRCVPSIGGHISGQGPEASPGASHTLQCPSPPAATPSPAGTATGPAPPGVSPSPPRGAQQAASGPPSSSPQLQTTAALRAVAANAASSLAAAVAAASAAQANKARRRSVTLADAVDSGQPSPGAGSPSGSQSPMGAASGWVVTPRGSAGGGHLRPLTAVRIPSSPTAAAGGPSGSGSASPSHQPPRSGPMVCTPRRSSQTGVAPSLLAPSPSPGPASGPAAAAGVAEGLSPRPPALARSVTSQRRRASVDFAPETSLLSQQAYGGSRSSFDLSDLRPGAGMAPEGSPASVTRLSARPGARAAAAGGAGAAAAAAVGGLVAGVGRVSQRRASGTISAQGNALIKQLNELDSHYGIAEDGRTVAMMSIRQVELRKLHGAGRASTDAPPGAASAPGSPSVAGVGAGVNGKLAAGDQGHGAHARAEPHAHHLNSVMVDKISDKLSRLFQWKQR